MRALLPDRRGSAGIVPMTIALIALSLATLTACGGDEKPRTKEAKPSIVGEWKRVTTCEERVKALNDAGLGKFAAEHAAGEGWIPGVTDVDQIKDPERPCRGAKQLEHSHFFTDDGQFGSLDDSGEEVDDGTYQLASRNRVVIAKEFGKITFAFTVTRDTLVLKPVMPDCTKTGCFAAQWAVGMSYPGLPWHRTG